MNYLCSSWQVHCYGSQELTLGRLACDIRGHLGRLVRIPERDRAAPLARIPYKNISAFPRRSSIFDPSGSLLGDRVKWKEPSSGVRAGPLNWAGVPICFCGPE